MIEIVRYFNKRYLLNDTIEKQIMMKNNKKLQQKRNNEADYKK